MQGTVLAGRYRLAETIGRGGAGTVYRATDERTGGTVAVKVLDGESLDDPETAELLQREARLAAAIQSPRVVRIIDVDLHDGLPFLVMEYVPGETLQEYLRRRGALPPNEALALCLEVARALEGAFAVGIVHRDLKPQNIKLVEGQIKVLDFGIARLVEQSEATRTHGFSGTPQYSAPERAWGGGDIRSDIYSLGVILYRALTGRLPFTVNNLAGLLYQHARVPVPELPDSVPAAVRDLTLRCLAKEPADRFQTPEELTAALRASLAELGGGSLGADSAAPAPVRPASPFEAADDTATARTATTRAGRPGRERTPATARDRAPRSNRAAATVPARAWRPSPAVIVLATTIVLVAAGAIGLLVLRGGGSSRQSAAGAGATGFVQNTGQNSDSAANARPSPRPPGAAVATPTAGAAVAGSPAGGTVTGVLAIDGPAQTVQIQVQTQPLLLGFDGIAGTGVTVALTAVTGSAAEYPLNVFVAAPDRTEIGRASVGAAGGPVHVGPLATTGRYTVALTLNNVAMAGATIAVVSDVTGTLTPGATAVNLTLAEPWQQGRLSFDAAQGQSLAVDLNVSPIGQTDCCLQAALVNPDGTTTPLSGSIGAGAQSLELGPLPMAGRYTFVLAPDAMRTATLSVSLVPAP